MTQRARHKQDNSFRVNKNLLRLAVAIVLVAIGVWMLIMSNPDCELIEYQNLSGTHYMSVCKGKGY